MTTPPKGYVPIIGEIVGDGEVRPPQGGNRVFSGDEMQKAFGEHPMGDFKPRIRRGKVGRKWMRK